MANDADKRPALTLPRRLLDVARRLFTPLALVFIAVAAFQSRDAFVEALAHARVAPLVVAALLWSALHLVVPLIPAATLKGLGTGIGYGTLLDIHIARLPARYMPGGIWQTVSRMVDLHGMGVDRSRLTVLVAVENVGPLATVLMLGGACAALVPEMGLPAAAIVSVGVVIAFVLPLALHRMLPSARLGTTHYGAALAASLLFWIGAAAAFAVYWSAFDRVLPARGAVELFATYLLSWAVGFVTVFAPQGLGVFEAVAAMLLRGTAAMPAIVMLVAGFRATTVVGDALVFVVGRIVRRLVIRPGDSH